jgi:hypothetical protein
MLARLTLVERAITPHMHGHQFKITSDSESATSKCWETDAVPFADKRKEVSAVSVKFDPFDIQSCPDVPTVRSNGREPSSNYKRTIWNAFG